MADGSDHQGRPVDEREAVVDTATAVAGAMFGQLPLNASFARAAYIESQANMAMRLKGAENFANVGNVTRATATGDSVEEGDDEDADTALAAARRSFEILELDRRQTREREEWLEKISTVGGVSMTGADWAKLAGLLRADDDLQRRLMSAFIGRGMTEDEAKARIMRVAEVSAAMALPPSQRTEEQKDLIEQADADPTFKEDMTAASAMLKNQGPQSGLSSTFATAQSGKEPAPSAVSKPEVALVSGPGF